MPVDLNGNTDDTDTFFIFGPFGFSLNIFIEIFATFLFCSVVEGEVWVALPQLPVSQVMFSGVPELTT